MLDRNTAENVLNRAAIAALGYHPDKSADQPGYTIDEDIDWVLEPLRGLPDAYRQSMRQRIREVITDPTGHRHAFTRDITALITTP
ncbi:hypothetical protein P0L94_08110 [Microbacter sp. GSS18]|nr:hypothetical protein P0L94_08110 [Microbacter sp. GSS18]